MMAQITMDHGVSGCFGTRLAPVSRNVFRSAHDSDERSVGMNPGEAIYAAGNGRNHPNRSKGAAGP